MKRFLFYSGIALLSFCFRPSAISAQESETADQNSAEWLTDFDEARQLAADQNRPILLSFSGSDWCIPCMRLERELFSTAEFAAFSKENLVLLKLDFPSRKKNYLSEEQAAHNEALAEQYNKTGAFPLVVITDANGLVEGYMEHPQSTAKAYLSSISSIIEQK